MKSGNVTCILCGQSFDPMSVLDGVCLFCWLNGTRKRRVLRERWGIQRINGYKNGRRKIAFLRERVHA